MCSKNSMSDGFGWFGLLYINDQLQRLRINPLSDKFNFVVVSSYIYLFIYLFFGKICLLFKKNYFF